MASTTPRGGRVQVLKRTVEELQTELAETKLKYANALEELAEAKLRILDMESALKPKDEPIDGSVEALIGQMWGDNPHAAAKARSYARERLRSGMHPEAVQNAIRGAGEIVD